MLNIEVANEAEAFALNNALNEYRNRLTLKALTATDPIARELADREFVATRNLHRRVVNAAIGLQGRK